jgi:D-alanyl-D-alanine carboxypeptidase
LGTGIDFGSVMPDFDDTAQGHWLRKHGGRFGFSLSYPLGRTDLTGYMYECWHYRYIGIDAARLTELYFGGLQCCMLTFLHGHAPR